MRHDEIAGLRLGDHGIEQVAEAFDVSVVERGIDLVEHADRRGIGEEQAEDERHRGQRLLPARQQRQRLQALAGWLGHDLQPRLQRIVAVDQREVRFAAAEQAGEQATEMSVDRLERCAQPFAPFAVEIADRSAQAIDRFSQFGLLAEARRLALLCLGKLLCGDQVDRPDPLALGLQPLVRCGFVRRLADVGQAADEAAAHERLQAERERIGPVNLVAAQELAKAEERQATSLGEQAELAEAVNRLRGSIGNLNREGRERLRAAFEAVDGHFRRLFTRLFGGGEAHLALVDSDDPLEAGLEIMAQPPGKRLQSLTLLSGGEQALTAVALIFGLFLTNPAPICVLDEVDAPLDDANIERFCDLLDAMVAETQTRYLIVTHNAVTMSRMHRLFGVTMVERGVSRLVSVDLGGAEDLLASA